MYLGLIHHTIEHRGGRGSSTSARIESIKSIFFPPLAAPDPLGIREAFLLLALAVPVRRGTLARVESLYSVRMEMDRRRGPLRIYS